MVHVYEKSRFKSATALYSQIEFFWGGEIVSIQDTKHQVIVITK